MQDRTTVRMTD